MMTKGLSIFGIFLILAGCSSQSDRPKKPLGATKQQAATQEALNDLASPAAPTTQIPPAGTPNIQPTVVP